MFLWEGGIVQSVSASSRMIFPARSIYPVDKNVMQTVIDCTKEKKVHPLHGELE